MSSGNGWKIAAVIGGTLIGMGIIGTVSLTRQTSWSTRSEMNADDNFTRRYLADQEVKKVELENCKHVED